MEKGKLRIYLGSAPGVGKTYAMLNEGVRRKARGHDVVIGYVETHNRINTVEQIKDLEIIPRKKIEYRGSTIEELDLDAILKRKPQIVLIDEFAHSNLGDVKNKKRYQDVEELLNAGIEVVTTLNVQHIESLNNIVERITGVVQRETVPDSVVRKADQIELVDMSPDSLRRRMAHGNIYAQDKVDAALANFFRPANLTALRELALLWVTDRVDDALNEYRDRYGIEDVWETRERIVVAVSGSHQDEVVIRRAARIASKSHGELLALHIKKDDGLSDGKSQSLEEQKKLISEVGGQYFEIVSTNIAQTLVHFANTQNATQIVIGSSTHSNLYHLIFGSVVHKVDQNSGDTDVHIVSRPHNDKHKKRKLKRQSLIAIPKRRQLLAAVLAIILLPLLSYVMLDSIITIDNSVVLPLYMLLTVIISAIGGAYVGVSCAFTASLIINWFFTPPVHTFTITETENIVSLFVFLFIAGVISILVDIAARRSYQAKRAHSEAETLARFAAVMLEPEPIYRLLEFLCETFEMKSAAIKRKIDNEFVTEFSYGDEIARSTQSDLTLEIDELTEIIFVGDGASSVDQRVASAFCAQLSIVLNTRRDATQAKAISQTNDLRAALLQSVSHDLRTPLSSIKASVSSLRQKDVKFSEEDSSEFLATIEEETDRLNRLVGNLLDMSRLNAEVVLPTLRPSALEEIIPLAIGSVGNPKIKINLPEDLPLVMVDPAMLERAIANLIDNAAKWSPKDNPPIVDASVVGENIHLRVIDHGKGIDIKNRETVFQPFQRLTDAPNDNGTGLGLAVALGFVRACNGRLWVDDTPGGGTTMTIELSANE